MGSEMCIRDRYKGYISSNKFSWSWCSFFRDKYNLNRERISIYEKLQILNYSDRFPKSSLKKVAEHFSTVFRRSITYWTVSAIKKNREKLMDEKREENARKIFSQDLYEEMSRRQCHTNEDLATYKNLRPLALELSANSKYEGYLSSHKFSKKWCYRFQEKYNLKEYQCHLSMTEKQQILQYSERNPESTLTETAEHFSTLLGQTISERNILQIRKSREKLMNSKEEENMRETFSQDLYEETEPNRRKFSDEIKTESSSN